MAQVYYFQSANPKQYPPDLIKIIPTQQYLTHVCGGPIGLTGHKTFRQGAQGHDLTLDRVLRITARHLSKS